MSIDITPARIKTTTNLQGLINTIVKNCLCLGVTSAAALSLPLGGKDADTECSAAIFFVSPKIPALENLDCTAHCVARPWECDHFA